MDFSYPVDATVSATAEALPDGTAAQVAAVEGVTEVVELRGATATLGGVEVALAEAREEGRPYIVDFGASWCQACGELERETFTDPRVIEEGSRFVAVHVDLSPGQDTPEKRALLRSYAQRGLPLVVLHGSDGREVHRVTQFVEPEELLSLMQTVQ